MNSWPFLWFLICGLVQVLFLSFVPVVIVMSSEVFLFVHKNVKTVIIEFFVMITKCEVSSV